MRDKNPLQAAGALAHLQQPVLGTLATINQIAITPYLDELGRGVASQCRRCRTGTENSDLQKFVIRLFVDLTNDQVFRTITRFFKALSFHLFPDSHHRHNHHRPCQTHFPGHA